ncbi:MAG: flagellin, partial [Synergistaceae bacterium]|nr:flagellin [Synergistaceae bacterium]
MIINNNITALSALNMNRATDTMLQKSIQPLATGLRINSSADDASGLAISERMRSQIRAYDMAVRNVQDGMSLLQTAEGSLGDANDMLHRMRELSVQASNDTLTSQDWQHIQEEIDGIRDQIQHIATYTNFNGKNLLDGTSGAFWSTSDENLKIRLNGKTAGYEKANQIVKAESDYRIEIKANPGTAQIQKSNIINT